MYTIALFVPLIIPPSLGFQSERSFRLFMNWMEERSHNRTSILFDPPAFCNTENLVRMS